MMNIHDRIENVATMICFVGLVLGLYSMGAGWFSAIAVVLLGNLNYNRGK